MERNPRLKEFTNEEIYILSRQAIESSVHIVMEERYSPGECRVHNNLMNEFIEERKARNVYGGSEDFGDPPEGE